MPDIFTRQPKKQPTVKPEPTATASKIEKTAPEIDSHNPFATFLQNPKGIALAGQDPDEKTILFLRADFFTNFSWILKTIIFSFIPLFVPFLMSLANIPTDFLPVRFNILIVSFYYLLLVGYAFAHFVTWFYTIGIATNKKAFDIDFNNLSSIDVATVNLRDASDAKYAQKGFFQSLFDYGDVIITIEATKEKLIFEKSPRPALVSDIIGDMIGGE